MLLATRPDLIAEYRRIRKRSVDLCAPLCAEDWRAQTMPDVSPPWWNLGHTSWFFARNVLAEFDAESRELATFAGFDYALNSYYEGLGPRLPRTARGRVAQPTTGDILRYRQTVDRDMANLLARDDGEDWPRLCERVTIGLQHEQQHQELLLSEILHIRWSAPPELRVPYRETATTVTTEPAPPMRFVRVAGGLTEIGADNDTFAWDNERPRHRAFVAAFELADRLVTCGEWLAFMADGGYTDPLLWLSNGWTTVTTGAWRAPMYWEERDGGWCQWTLRGVQPVEPAAPVCHVSFYEADAFARWAGARLPTEHEWEQATNEHGFDVDDGNLLDDDALRTLPARGPKSTLAQMAGDVWEWTNSHYEPYPGYRAYDGALSEYNGKFMDNQRVLRGGSLATPRDHARASYRNFWPADTRFQFTGLRLAR
ncbi:MAG: ergothioneine biosynthesis protein EgtB [Planctomycetota bacterium]